MIAPICLAGAGAVSIAAATLRGDETLLKPFGFALVAAALTLAAVPARADEHVQAVDNGEVACTLSSRELTRIALVGDAFASVSKITSGSPLEDFTVTNEPVRGDIYLSVPPGFVGPGISFFATSRQGFVYKFVCALGAPDAAQVFVTNPAIAPARDSGAQPPPPPRDAAVELIRAMAASEVLDGFALRQPAARASRIGELTVRLVAEYRGATLIGRALRIDNRSARPIPLRAADFAPVGTLAAGLEVAELASGQATTIYVVGRRGDGAW